MIQEYVRNIPRALIYTHQQRASMDPQLQSHKLENLGNPIKTVDDKKIFANLEWTCSRFFFEKKPKMLLWTRRMQFWQPCQIFFYRKRITFGKYNFLLFAQNPKIILKMEFFEKKILQIVPLDNLLLKQNFSDGQSFKKTIIDLVSAVTI